MKNLILRLYFAYRHSFRSGCGFAEFLECWKLSGRVFDDVRLW